MHFELSVIIHRSPDDVFHFLRDKDKHPRDAGSPVLVLEQTTPGPAGWARSTPWSETVHAHGLLRVLEPIIERKLGRQLRNRLEAIKSVLDALRE